MKSFLGAIAVVIFAGAAWAGSSITTIEVPSPSLAKAELGAVATQKAAVYLPPSYDGSANRYPVVYFLPGYNTTVERFTAPGRFDLKSVMDRLVAAGKVREMIVVIASGYTPLGGGFYVNSPVNGNWEDYVAADLVTHIDRQYRTLTTPASRGIAGQSMGGFGALYIAMRHPELYGAVYSMSPGVAVPGGMKTHPAFDGEARTAALTILKNVSGLKRAAALRELVKQADALQGPAAAARFALAYGITFAPLPGSALAGHPYAPGDAWVRYETGFGDWAARVDSYGANFKAMRSVTIDVGDHDHYVFIREGCAYLSKLMTDAGISHRYDVYPGDHSDKIAERIEQAVLPTLSAALGSVP